MKSIDYDALPKSNNTLFDLFFRPEKERPMAHPWTKL